MEKRRVVITGLGTVNPLGNTAAASWAAARAGQCGIGPITQFDTTGFKCTLAGEVKDFDPSGVIDRKEARKMARFTQMALAAAAEALADSGLEPAADDAAQIGVIVSSGIGSLPTIEEQALRGAEKGYEKISPYFVPMSIANMAAAQIAIRFGLKGMCSCPVTACAGGTNAVGDAFHRIRDGYEQVMVCGGAESCISPLGIGGFASMKALSTSVDPEAASLPFDARRGGFVMGEGSGILVLESLEHAQARGAYIYAEVVGYGANCDAHHFTAPAPGGAGAADCMRLALADGGIAPEQVDHINAHGTGTHMNDSCETAAIHTVFGEHAREIAVCSTKSMTGHLLGGAGGVEAVFTALAVRDSFVPPTIHYEQPDPECDLDYTPNVGREMPIRYALSNSLGFGGHNACLVFGKWEG
ncbi:MAG: beta-ketoacyl-ACP synthase II [Faecalibacterium sp.]